MFKFIGKSLAGVVLTKEAQEAVKKSREIKPVATAIKASGATKPLGKTIPAPSGKRAAAASMRAPGKDLVTPEREALIKNALKVRAAKQSIVADLSDEARANLVGIALIGLLHADEPKN